MMYPKTNEVLRDEEVTDEDSASGYAWPDDWRQQITQDEKELEQIGRYATPADIWTKARALEQKMSSGDWKQVSPYPEKGTEDEQAQWRKNNQIPESYDKYEIAREMEDEEKAQLESFLKYAHANNMPTPQTNLLIDYFYQRADEDIAAADQRDKQNLDLTDDALRAEWGNEYRTNINKIESFIDLAPAKVKEDIFNARLPDGSTLRTNPDAMKFLLTSALAYNPTTVVVGEGGDVMSSIQDEMDEIKSKMNTKEYKEPGSKMRKRYTKLLEEMEKLQGRGAVPQ